MFERSHSRRQYRVVVQFLVAVLLLGVLGGCRSPERPPSFVVILADDARAVDLEQLPATVAAIGAEGLTFDRSYVTTSLCCPSRVSLLTGKYAHRHGLLSIGPPLGGAPRLRKLGVEADTIATRLQALGYRTGFIGKYVYGTQRMPVDDVPPGWDLWIAFNWPGYQDYRLREGGQLTHYGMAERDYSTDVLYRKARRFLEGARDDPRPFFLLVAPYAPHTPSTPPERYRNLAVGPSGQSAYGQGDGQTLGPPPGWATGPSTLPDPIPDVAEQIADHRRSLWALDDLVIRVVEQLGEIERTDTTWTVFTSDNGLLLGEHSLFYRKHAAYEPSIQVPLLVRGPRSPKGTIRSELVANIDLAPTLVELAGAADPEAFDGRSMAKLWRGQRVGEWREDLLIELFDKPVAGTPPPYQALRGDTFLYVRYDGGLCEYFDTAVDPQQLDNRCGALSPARRAELDARLDQLEACEGPSCW
jgi:arylsulfatase A-like enzyme